MKSLYIHIPFCEQICTYCDFAKEVDSQNKKGQYIHALIREINTNVGSLKNIETIFIGGGTPSVLTIGQLSLLGSALNTTIDFSKIKEFSIECNPSDINKEKALKLMDIGVNRISLGVQTFNDNHLKFLNRTHQSGDVAKAIQILRDVGFNNISVDMLFGLPNQTLDDVKHDVDKLLDFNLEHISYYNLILEEGTKLYQLVKKGSVKLLDDDYEATMYEWIIEVLQKHGYKHYEISNFSKPSKEGLHNVRIWKDADYLGLGVGAHSKHDNKRFANTSRLQHYLLGIEEEDKAPFEIYEYEPVRDYLLNGLRLREGISLSRFENRFGRSVISFYPEFEHMIREGFLMIENDRLYLTHKGLMYGNAIFSMV